MPLGLDEFLDAMVKLRHPARALMQMDGELFDPADL
jgi:hypothetical protein